MNKLLSAMFLAALVMAVVATLDPNRELSGRLNAQSKANAVACGLAALAFWVIKDMEKEGK